MTTATPEAPVLAKHEAAADTHAVFATTWQHTRLRVSDPLAWGSAQSEWRRLDDARSAGLMPHVKFFEVRSMADPNYRSAPLSLAARTPVVPGRGYGKVEDAARAAWLRFAPTYTPRRRWSSGVQGRGGWFYWPNGRTAAQGLSGLARLCRQRGMVVEGNGRWYVADPDAA